MRQICDPLDSFVFAAKAVSGEVTPTQVNISEEANATNVVEFTEQCLPLNLASSSEIGNPDTCNCNVIVLSFQDKCLEDHNSSHITYLFDPNTGW